MLLDKDYNLIPFLGVLITVGTMLWFTFQDIDVGYTYTLLFIVPCVLLLILYIFINERSARGIVGRLKFPFTTSTVGGATMLLLGWIVYIVVNSVGQVFSSKFSITKFMIPLAAQKTNILIQQTSQQLSISTSRAVQLFTSTFVASFIEEFVFGFVLVYVFYVLTKFVANSVLNKQVSHNTTLVITFILLGITFAWMHKLNASYVGNMFLVAAVFRILMSASIYYAGLFLSFTIGFHQANNFIWYVQTNGWQQTMGSLLSVPGAIMILYMVLMVIIVLNNLKPAENFLSRLIKDFRRSVL